MTIVTGNSAQFCQCICDLAPAPTANPTAGPTTTPTFVPTVAPTTVRPKNQQAPTTSPTFIPTVAPTTVPTEDPTAGPLLLRRSSQLLLRPPFRQRIQQLARPMVPR